MPNKIDPKMVQWDKNEIDPRMVQWQNAAPSETPDYSPTGGMSGMDKFRAGWGKSVADLYQGAKQVASGVGDIPMQLLMNRPYESQRTLELKQQADEQRRLDAPLMQTGAGFVGNLAGSVANTVPLALVPGANTYTGAGLIGAGTGALNPVGERDNRAVNAGISGALSVAGQGVSNYVRGAAVGKKLKLDTPEDATQAQVVKWAQQNDIPMTYGQMTSNPGAPNATFGQRVEKMLSGLPGASGFYAKTQQAQQKGLNKKVAELVGGKTDEMFENWGKGKALKIDDKFIDELDAIKDKFAGLGRAEDPLSAFKDIDSYTAGRLKVGDSLPAIGPKDSFNNYQALRSLYGNRAYKATDPVDKAAYRSLRDAFDNLAERNYPNSGIKDIRGSYQIESLTNKAKDPVTENYSWGKAARAIKDLKGKDKAALEKLGARGAELENIAQAQPYMNWANTSGTAENYAAQQLATAGLLGGGGALGTWMATGDPRTAIYTGAGLLGGTYVAPALVNAALQSGRGRLLGPTAANVMGKMPNIASATLNRIPPGMLSRLPFAISSQQEDQ
jgi:hypothetical protein